MKNITFLSTLLATTILAGNIANAGACSSTQVQASDGTCYDVQQSCGQGCSYTLTKDADDGHIVATINSGVTSIPNDGLYKKNYINEVIIPDSVTSIGRYTFADATSLESLTIGKNVTSIGNFAFLNATSLKSLTIGENVTSIGDYAFQYATSLTSLTIPDSVTKIGWHAFSGATSLESLTIPDSVTSIGSYAFENLNSNAQIYCEGDMCDYLKASRGSLGLGAQSLTKYTKDENGVYDVGGTLYSSAADMQTGTSSASCGDMATCLASIGTHCSTAKECQTLLDMSSEGTNCDSLSNCKTYLAEHPSAGNKTDSALIEKYNGTPLLYGKRIYTVEEANEVAGKKNRVMIRYK